MPEPQQEHVPGLDLAREIMTAPELALVCAAYPIGKIESIQELRAGGSDAPKALITSSLGRFLLKRRAPGRDNPFRVAFSHEIQLRLSGAGYPTPEIVGTRAENNSMFQHDGRVYELFRYIPGEPWEPSVACAVQAGAAPARFHELVRPLDPAWKPPGDALVTMDTLTRGLERACGRDPGLAGAAERLHDACARAHAKLPPASIQKKQAQIIHADWHPGNLIFSEGRLAAVLDFDSARYGPALVDIAQGVLNFSMTRAGPSPSEWTDGADMERLAGFWAGYRDGDRLGQSADPGAIPFLMIRTLAAEPVAQIATSGRFGRHGAREILDYVARRASWMLENAASIASLLRE